MVATVSKSLSIVALVGAVLVLSASVALAAGGPGDAPGGGGGRSGGGDAADVSPAVLTCMKKVLPAAEYAAFARSKNPGVLSAGSVGKARACFASGGSSSAAVKVTKTGAWIVASPFDLASVTSISVFRSCSGHDYSGRNIQGQAETDRSMKHYINTSIPWEPARTLKGVAPFAGTVTVQDEQFPLGKQIRITSTKLGWTFVFFHGDPLVAAGTTVKAGQPIVAWPPTGALQAFAAQGAGQHDALSFDVALVSADGAIYESMFLHMAPAVAARWAAKGWTAKTAIVSKAARDRAPCNGTYNGSDVTDFVPAKG